MPTGSGRFVLPNLEYHRKLAKEMLKAHRAGEEAAAHSFRWYHPRHRDRSIAEILAQPAKLSDAQLVVARQARFESWPRLKEYIEQVQASGESPAARFEAAADCVVIGNTEGLLRLLDENPGLANAPSPRPHGATLLHYSSANGVEDQRQRTPANAVEVADMLIAHGADINAPADFYGGGGGSTPLVALVTSVHPAEAGLQPDLVRSFARSGQNVNGLDDDGMPIAYALLFRYPAAGHALAEAGARVDNAVVAAGLGEIHALQSLLADTRPPQADPGVLNSCIGASLDRTTTPAQALLVAAMAGELTVIDYLLSAGVDPNTPLNHGITALHEAAFGGRLAAVERLVEAGARTDIVERQYGATAAGWAAHAGQDEVVRFLEEC